MSPVALVTLLLAPAAGPRPTPEQVFAERLLPIFNSPNPSSCVQCHLAGVDLKDYIRPSHRETFLSLRDQGLIDLDHPAKSKILALIDMGREDKAANSIHQKARRAEYEAFAAWVTAGAADPELRTAPKLAADRLAKPARPDAVLRHARTDNLLATFQSTVWALRFRCANCHTEGLEKTTKYAAEHGNRVAWLKADDPEATLTALRTSGLIDAKNPADSLLLTKPLNQVEHQGGRKFRPGDQGYKAFRRFLDDYAKTVGDGYRTAADLPAPPAVLTFGTEQWLKITDTPPAWAGRLLVVKVYAWDAAAGGWEAEPVAVSDHAVSGERRQWQHSLILSAARGSDRAKAWLAGRPALPEGRYLIKVYVDRDRKLDRDPAAELGDAEYAGRAELRTAWPAGYGKMTPLPADRVRKE